MKIAQITRQLSFEDIKPKKLTKHIQILEVLGNREMTAREIETEMNKKKYSQYFDMNHVRPRLTELEKMGYVEETAKKTCEYTGKAVTVYKITQKGYEAFNYNHIPRID